MNKITEANEHRAKAEKYLKTSLLRWKPNYELAADHYAEAGRCFRVGHDYTQARLCHQKAAEYYKLHESPFQAAKSLESAIIVSKGHGTPEFVNSSHRICQGCRDLVINSLGTDEQLSSTTGHRQVCVNCGRSVLRARSHLLHTDTERERRIHAVICEWILPRTLYNMALESASLYQQHGSGDSGASILIKVAKIIEDQAPALAVILYQQAAEVSVASCSEHQGAEYMNKAARLFVKLERYDEAAESLRQEITYQLEMKNFGAVGRLTVAAFLVHLARGDSVGAEKAYKEWGNYCEASEAQTLMQLIEAYDENDRDAAKRALSNPFIRNMDVEFARLSLKVPLPKEMDVELKQDPQEKAGPSSSHAKPARAVTGGSTEMSPSKPIVTLTKSDSQEEELC